MHGIGLGFGGEVETVCSEWEGVWMVRRGTWEEGVRVAPPFMRLTWVVTVTDSGYNEGNNTSEADDGERTGVVAVSHVADEESAGMVVTVGRGCPPVGRR